MARRPRETTVRQAAAITEEAARLFAERGYHGTSMRDIAEVFGLNPGSLYVYIGSKQQLLESIVDSVLQPLGEALDVAEGHLDDPLLALKLVARGRLRVQVNHPLRYRVFDRESRHLEVEVRDRVVMAQARMDERLQGIITAGIQVGALRRIEPARIASAAFTENLHSVFERVGSLQGQSVEDFADAYTGVLLDGWRFRGPDGPPIDVVLPS